MEQKIMHQLEMIEKSTQWIKSSLDGEKQKNAYRNLVDCRRQLKRKKNVLESNPAAAIYGESQVGKSYLISSLLSENGKSFSITDEEKVLHNFIKEINPPGGGNESTSLVSRFSVNYKPANPNYPVKAILLSPADIVLLLCDSFYNDIKADHNLILHTDEINSIVNLLKQQYHSAPQQQNVFTEDDVIDMQDYFKEHFSSKASNVLFSHFFEEISLFISKVHSSQWKSCFSLLWNKNENFTTLFDTLISEFEKLNFATFVYLPLESVLVKYGTLLDVKRLKEIYSTPNRIEQEYKEETKLLLPDNRELYFKKSYLCALSAELIFSQEETLLETKPFLNETDLLDFPGARSRMTLQQNKINHENIPELLIRGKVAYLFNKYSEFGKISIFILCAKHEQAAQRSMPEMLNSWICKFIGDTPEKREVFVNNSKIPPLFIIGTFFNVNLEYNPLLDHADNLSSLNYRWEQRFDRTLAVELLNAKTHSWFNNWTVSEANFRNIFLLRDFVYSESKSQIFKGFLEDRVEKQELFPQNYPDFRKKLRQSFIEYPFVKNHFGDPEYAWDESATINKDGTKLIIDRLTIAANNINHARREITLAQLNEITQKILRELLKYFHSNDKDEELQKAKSIAGDIQHKLDIAFSADGIKKFGKLMKELMLDEGSVLELYRKTIDDIEHRDVIINDKYSTYRIQVPVSVNDTAETYFDRLSTHYEKNTDEHKQQFRAELEAKNIDLSELIHGNSNLIKNNAEQLADALLEFWFSNVTLSDKHTVQQILTANDSTALQDIMNMFQLLFKKTGLSKKIAEKIRLYVDGHSKTELPYEIVSDMSAEMLNKFVNTVGFEYFDQSEINDLRVANTNNMLGLVIDLNTEPTEKSVADLFTKIDNWTDIIQSKPEEMKSMPSYRNYLSWYHRLKVGFISVCDIPNYDLAANEKLGNIINELKPIKY